MFRKEKPEPEFVVLPIDSIVVKDGHFYRVHDYGLVEVPAPLPLEQPEPSNENTEEA